MHDHSNETGIRVAGEQGPVSWPDNLGSEATGEGNAVRKQLPQPDRSASAATDATQ